MRHWQVRVPDRETPPPEGQLGHRYALKRRVGRGGSAIVYQAWDRARCCHVALKRPLADAVPGDWRTEQLLREIVPASAASHPCLARLLDWGVVGENPYLAYEFVGGGSLSCYLREGRLTQLDLLQAAWRVADGLAALHARGWVHGDVTPANILFHRSGQPCLTDFGLARPAGTPSRTEARVFASTSYAPLEQLAGQPLSPAADTYSLCAVLFQALTGQQLHRGGSRQEIVAGSHQLTPQIGRQLGPVLLRGLAATPARRYPDGAALRDALQAAAAGILSTERRSRSH